MPASMPNPNYDIRLNTNKQFNEPLQRPAENESFQVYNALNNNRLDYVLSYITGFVAHYWDALWYHVL